MPRGERTERQVAEIAQLDTSTLVDKAFRDLHALNVRARTCARQMTTYRKRVARDVRRRELDQIMVLRVWLLGRMADANLLVVSTFERPAPSHNQCPFLICDSSWLGDGRLECSLCGSIAVRTPQTENLCIVEHRGYRWALVDDEAPDFIEAIAKPIDPSITPELPSPEKPRLTLAAQRRCIELACERIENLTLSATGSRAGDE